MGCMVCSGGVLVLLVAGVALVLLAPLQVSSSFYVSVKRVGHRHHQQQALPGVGIGHMLLTLEETLTPVYIR